jgi:hypothetical protein
LETLDELTMFLAETTADGFRGRLQARGEARAIIRQDGVLPDDAPAFGETIDTDLTEYGFSLLRASLALREAEGNPVIWRRGFVRAGNASKRLCRMVLRNPLTVASFASLALPPIILLATPP